MKIGSNSQWCLWSNVCGPMSVESIGGKKYFITFIDDYSHYCSVYFLRQKSEVFKRFKEFQAAVENETEYQIESIRTDNGGSIYHWNLRTIILMFKGIHHELIVYLILRNKMELRNE